MEKKKTMILILIGLFIFLFGIIGITYAYWQITLTQKDENLVYTDCLQITTSLTSNGAFTLEDAYPMTNEELIKDFFPNQEPYHFTIENVCSSEVPISINMESLTTQNPNLKDDYVDVILWEDNDTNVFNPEEDTVLSHIENRNEIGSIEPTPSYKLTDHNINKEKIISDSKEAYQLYKFVLSGKKEGSTDHIKEFNLLLFMDYDTPVSTPDNVTNHAIWEGKITLSNYEIPKVKIGGIEIALADGEDGLYEVIHDDLTNEENEILDDDLEGWQKTEYRYAGNNPNNYVWFNCEEGYPQPMEDNVSYCEKWRIIGLTNVKVDKGNGQTAIEQRLKLIRDNIIGEYAWNSNRDSDWTKATLMQMLNGAYYSDDEFDGGETDAKGLSESARKMIDKETSWNIGGTVGWDTSNVKLADMYGYERGTLVFGSSYPAEWNSNNTVGATFNGVALMYPSDYGYATTGSNNGTTRNKCINDTALYSYDSDSGCYEKDWLFLGESDEWFLTPDSETGFGAYVLSENGYIHHDHYYNYVDSAYRVRPVVYLSNSVQIKDNGNDGSYEHPYELELVE